MRDLGIARRPRRVIASASRTLGLLGGTEDWLTHALRKRLRQTVILFPTNAMDHRLNDMPFAAPVDRRALDDLFCATYEELRRLASAVRRDDPGATLTPTALVNEAWLKLANSPHLALGPASALQADRRASDAAGPDRGRPAAPRVETRRTRRRGRR